MNLALKSKEITPLLYVYVKFLSFHVKNVHSTKKYVILLAYKYYIKKKRFAATILSLGMVLAGSMVTIHAPADCSNFSFYRHELQHRCTRNGQEQPILAQASKAVILTAWDY